MRISSTKSRFIAALSSATLVAAVVIATPAHAAAVGPICDGKVPVQTCQGTTSDGAPFVMMVPANFNGTVALYSHGYRYNIDLPAGMLPSAPAGYKVTNTPEPIPGGNPDIANYFLGNGMAIVGSGFSRQGWNLDAAVATNVELVAAFKKQFPKTNHVLAWGSSLGGIITQTLAEKYPTLVDAVAPMCMADNISAELTAAGDVLWGLKTFFDPTIKGGNYSAGAAGNAEAIGDIVKVLTVLGSLKNSMSTGAWPATSSATGKALEAAGVPSRSALLLVGLMAGLPTQSDHFDSISGPDGALKLTFPLAISPALATLENAASAAVLAILATQDVELQAGGAVYDNTKTDYSARVEDSSVIYNAALSGNTVIGAMLAALNPANPGAPRAKGNPAAMAMMGKMAPTTGKINMPTVMMTGVADPITPAGATQRVVDAYAKQLVAEHAAAIAAAKSSKSYQRPKNNLVVLWSTTPKAYTTFDAAGGPITSTPAAPGTNHCTFSTANLLTVAKMMVSAGTTGKFPNGGPIASAARKSGNLSVDKYFRAPLLKYYNE
jgi:pimeloyl-ACP methyl ester carboxylesterase